MLFDSPLLLSHFSPLDGVAITLLLFGWLGSTVLIERANTTNPSTHILMEDYRIKWMQEMITRQPRMFDSSILTMMRNGATFFSSSCMIAIGGCVALLGVIEQMTVIAGDLTQTDAAPQIVWEIKIVVLILILANSFLKFVWSVRLFGYCAIVMASVSNDPDDPQAAPTARKAADIANHAARSFNRGLRSIYFSIATLTWLLGPAALIVATTVTILLLYRREFTSRTHAVLAL